MSFIGSLDQFDLSIILQKIEEYQKTGVLTIRRGATVVELCFRQGQMVCIGPIKPGLTIGERLVRAGVISSEVCASVELALGERASSEYEAVKTFLETHYIDEKRLVAWASTESSQVLTAILGWEEGDLYFEAEQLPPAHRYTIPLSVTALFPSQPGAALAATSAAIDDSSADGVERHTDALSPALVAEAQQTVPTTDTLLINPSLIHPSMRLAPADLAAYRDSNGQVLLTPEQWRLFTRADAETTLAIAAHELHMAPDQVCQIACELHALGLVNILPSPMHLPFLGTATFARNQVVREAGDSMGANGSYGLRQPEMAYLAAAAHQHTRQPIETQSQWGNGGNGATFQLGNGWVVAPAAPQQARQRNAEPANERVYSKTA